MTSLTNFDLVTMFKRLADHQTSTRGSSNVCNLSAVHPDIKLETTNTKHRAEVDEEAASSYASVDPLVVHTASAASRMNPSTRSLIHSCLFDLASL